MSLNFDADAVYAAIADLEWPCYIAKTGDRVGAANHPPEGPATLLAVAAPLPPERLGSPEFLRRHGVRYPYMAGSMAGGIASTDLVTAMARAGYLASFGAAGLAPDRIDQALTRLARDLPGLPFASNLLHTPRHLRWERTAVDLYLRHRVRCVEASAFVTLTPDVVRYRLAGLRPDARTGVHAKNRLIAKVSRPEIAELFLRPAPESLVAELLATGAVTPEQARLARNLPLADDITVEADSAGHTDRRPLATAVPQMLKLRDETARTLGLPRVRIGAAGSLGTPQAVFAAFALGAEYVVTGSINQACVEAATSPQAKRLLAEAGPADCAMAPAADMFEMGADVQVLQRGTLYPGRAARLYRLYRDYGSLEVLPETERERLRIQVFRRGLDDVWAETVAYLTQHHPDELERATYDPRHQMALLFRWYLGMSSRWATTGEADRIMDYQIWCGPAMGAFNTWVRSTALEPLHARRVADIAHHLLRGAAFQARVCQLRFAGVRIPAGCTQYRLPSARQPALTPAL